MSMSPYLSNTARGCFHGDAEAVHERLCNLPGQVGTPAYPHPPLGIRRHNRDRRGVRLDLGVLLDANLRHTGMRLEERDQLVAICIVEDQRNRGIPLLASNSPMANVW